MIANYNQLVEHNKKFYDAFVDLKVTGWKSYSKALNSYTLGFFKEQLISVDNAVEKTATTMKELTNVK